MRKRWERFLSVLFQSLLLLMAAIGFVVGDMYAAWSSVFGFVLSSVPWFLKRGKILVAPFELTLWIFVALFLHNLGVLANLYDDLWWWDKVTHFLSTSLIAAFGMLGVVIVDKYVESIYLPPRFLPFFILVFVGAMGVLWELIEFILDSVVGTAMQYSLEDTVLDLVFDTLAGVVVAVIGPIYLKYRTVEAIVNEMKVEKTVKRITARRRDWQ
mgnify:CR=1 FL=1